MQLVSSLIMDGNGDQEIGLSYRRGTSDGTETWKRRETGIIEDHENGRDRSNIEFEKLMSVSEINEDKITAGKEKSELDSLYDTFERLGITSQDESSPDKEKESTKHETRERFEKIRDTKCREKEIISMPVEIEGVNEVINRLTSEIANIYSLFEYENRQREITVARLVEIIEKDRTEKEALNEKVLKLEKHLESMSEYHNCLGRVICLR